MSEKAEIKDVLAGWRLPDAGSLMERVEAMVRPALRAGYFGTSFTRVVSGVQYHLGGTRDTEELAQRASVSPSDRLLDVACFLGGPAIQLAENYWCQVMGIDQDVNVIAAAKRISDLAGLSGLAEFRVGNAAELPFSDGTFTVVWNQCSLEHDERWIKEFDRVLAPGGRLAFTFQFRGPACTEEGPFSRWTLQDAADVVRALGFELRHVEDLTARDIEIGWLELDRRLSEGEKDFAAALGAEWVAQAHAEFAKAVEEMRAGKWGNGRIVAVKLAQDT
ncbi:MAG: methyltransferase domain-containing protein [Kiritimatiellae bacterium]|nr:methyltransferase domain-containing protein [Kiritimatiellia bacterium]